MSITERLGKLGFGEANTGGGCKAYSLKQDEIEILVTTECDLPLEGKPVQLGWYKEGEQVRVITLEPPYGGLEKIVKA